MTSAGKLGADRVKVWDLPTRLFHWLLAGSFAVAWVTHEHDRYLDIHVFAGYLFLGLLLFRLAWGFTGGRYARFRAFRYRWSAAWDYLLMALRGRAQRHLGHNPAGSPGSLTSCSRRRIRRVLRRPRPCKPISRRLLRMSAWTEYQFSRWKKWVPLRNTLASYSASRPNRCLRCTRPSSLSDLDRGATHRRVN